MSHLLRWLRQNLLSTYQKVGLHSVLSRAPCIWPHSHKFFSYFIFLLFLLQLSLPSYAGLNFLPVHRPYLPSLEKQQQQHFLTPPYVSPGELNWTTILFADKLIADFYRKYEEEIGNLESTRLIRSFPEFYDHSILDSLSFRQELIEQSKSMLRVGEYITLKISEFHLDNYLKRNPRTKKVYEYKVKYTSANVDLGKKSFLKFNYSISGNYLEFRYTHEDLLISYKMEFKRLNEGFFQQAESIFLMDYLMPAKLALRILYFALERGYSVIVRRAVYDNLTLSLTYNGDREIPDSLETENSILLGAVFYLPPSL